MESEIMKKEYIKPIFTILIFDSESIMTASSKSYAVKGASEYFNNE